jgi:type I restriction enzyme M protein
MLNSYSQYFTPNVISQYLINEIELKSPKKLIDLGVGKGELLSAASDRWPDALTHGVDIDSKVLEQAKKLFPVGTCHEADALLFNLPSILGIDLNSIDVAVGNPPYGTFDVKQQHIDIIKEVGLSETIPRGKITREIVFLAQNLRLLKSKGQLIVLLPESIGTGTYYYELRKYLILNHGLSKVIELPRKLFEKTEAKTLVFFLKKNTNCDEVVLEKYDQESTTVSILDACYRLDASYYLGQRKKGRVLSDLDPVIKRGLITHSEAKKSYKKNYFHTTSFKNFPNSRINFKVTKESSLTSRELVRENDILISRVGTRCLDYCAIVSRGEAVFTDCIYRIQVDLNWQELLFEYLKSEEGINERLRLSRGVCARYLTIKDLLNLPIPF